MSDSVVDVHLARTAGDAHAALLHLVAEVTGSRPARLSHACRQCGSAVHGRPVLPGRSDVHVSLSRPRDDGPALVAVCTSHSVGVDVEAVGGAGFTGFDGVALHPRESAADDSARTRLWVRKEALLKAAGVGLVTDPRRVWIDESGTVREGPAGCVVEWEDSGQVIAVAVTPPAQVRLVWHELRPV